MPVVAKSKAQVIETGPVVEHKGEIDGYSISFITFGATVDGAPLLKGLPGDQCQCPHWGYVLKGEISWVINGVEEVNREGEAFYVAPGHTPGAKAGAEVLMFSPTDLLRETEQTMERNFKAIMQG